MLTIQNRGAVNSQRISFQKHLPRTFGGMMNHLYKNTPDIFEYSSSVRVSTILPNGQDVSGTVNFIDGQYAGLVLDEGFEHLRQIFMRTALEKYKNKISSPKLQEKLTRNKH